MTRYNILIPYATDNNGRLQAAGRICQPAVTELFPQSGHRVFITESGDTWVVKPYNGPPMLTQKSGWVHTTHIDFQALGVVG